MLVVCPDCEARHEVSRQSRNSELKCRCGKSLSILPWLSYRQVASGEKAICCPLCSQEYNLKHFRNNTEIACTCGNLFRVQHDMDRQAERGRRGNDLESGLRELELQGLIDTSRLIHSSIQNLDHLLMLIIRITSEMLDVEGCTVVLCDPTNGDLVFHAITGKRSDRLNRFRLTAGEGVVGGCIQNQEPVLINDAQKDKRFSDRADRVSGLTTHSILCVPLSIENECIGALEMVNKKHHDGFCSHDLLLAEAVASQIAVAIRNVHLTEEALKAERLAAIGQAVAGIAHCIKNMLGSIQGSVELVGVTLDRLTGGKPDQSYELLRKSQERMTSLVMNMLTFTKEREPQYVEKDINQLVVSVVDTVKASADEHGVTISIESDSKVPPFYMDPPGIFRCLLNLATNAVDACGREGGAVTMATRIEGSDTVAMRVIDSGTGMTPEIQNQVYQPFYSTKGSEGTGLGLAVTRKIVQEHGGSIAIDSAPGEGCTFTIRLPFRRESPN